MRTKQRGLVIVFAALVLTSGAGTAQAQKLMLFGGPGHTVYLGCLSCAKDERDGVFNPYSEYGRTTGENSIWNIAGFGSIASDYSPWSLAASEPPIIVDEYGKSYGRFTVQNTRMDQTRIGWVLQVLASGQSNYPRSSFSVPQTYTPTPTPPPSQWVAPSTEESILDGITSGLAAVLTASRGNKSNGVQLDDETPAKIAPGEHIETRIAGSVTAFMIGTRWKLDNGWVVQQTEAQPRMALAKPLENPVVWLMTINGELNMMLGGAAGTIRIRRIQ